MSRINSAAFDDLNAEQRAAVEHGLEPLLVIAGAGSGKTKTLSCRVAHLVVQCVEQLVGEQLGHGKHSGWMQYVT